jgi:hypothetical protein
MISERSATQQITFTSLPVELQEAVYQYAASNSDGINLEVCIECAFIKHSSDGAMLELQAL